MVFVISFLLQRENLRDRFIRLVGSRDLHRTTEALNEAGTRVSRYLLLQMTVNCIYAVPICFGLRAIGVPNALLWALLVVLMRFVPYVGIIIAALFPLALSLAVDPGWNMLVWTAVLFVSMEMIFGNVIEPWLYGMNTGLSPVAIIVAATFWTWLWGPIGLLLSTPLTVCLVVLGRHAPAFALPARAAGKRRASGAIRDVLPTPVGRRSGRSGRNVRGVPERPLARPHL